MCCVLKAGVHVWVKDIQKLANLTNRSFPESAAEEMHFWSSIGEALDMTNTELRSGELSGRLGTYGCKGIRKDCERSVIGDPGIYQVL